LRIFAIQPFARTPGHYDRLTQRTCEAFGRLGNDVTLITYCGIGAQEHDSPPSFKVVNAVTHRGTGRAPDYRRRRVYVNGLRAFLNWQIRDLRTCYMAASLLRQQEGSVAHFYDSDAVMLTLVINFWLRSRRPVTLLTIHQVDRPFSSSKHLITRLNRWLYRRCLARLITQDLDGLVVLDPSIKQLIVSRLNITPEAADRIRVLPHGTDLPVGTSSKDEARRRLQLQPDDAIFLIFGVLRKDKRIDLAVEAVEGLSHCRLVIAGGPQDFTEASVTELIRRHGCQRSVSIEIDYVSEQRMHDYFSACDAVVIPYARSFKGQSAILTLACGHGKPVIASDVGILGEAVKEHKLGFAVEPESSSALREAILRCLALSSDEREQLEQRVKSYATLMSWENTCREWLKFYQALSGKRSVGHGCAPRAKALR
jgi:glycosyltransferase involved in cell wall biosynthesis